MDLAKLFKSTEDSKTFPAGTTIFEEGQPGDFMYVVQQGEVEIRRGAETLEVVSAGGIIGEMALIDNSARSATTVARTDSTLVAIDVKRFTFLVQQTPYFAIHLLRVLVDRLRRTTDRAIR